MAKREEIVIEIDEQGNLSADVMNGPGGEACLADIEKLLGKDFGTSKKAETKPEYWQQNALGRSTVKRGR